MRLRFSLRSLLAATTLGSIALAAYVADRRAVDASDEISREARGDVWIPTREEFLESVGRVPTRSTRSVDGNEVELVDAFRFDALVTTRTIYVESVDMMFPSPFVVRGSTFCREPLPRHPSTLEKVVNCRSETTINTSQVLAVALLCLLVITWWAAPLVRKWRATPRHSARNTCGGDSLVPLRPPA